MLIRYASAHQAALERIAGSLNGPNAVRKSRVEHREAVEARLHRVDEMSLLQTDPWLEGSPVVQDVWLEDHRFPAGESSVIPICDAHNLMNLLGWRESGKKHEKMPRRCSCRVLR